MYGGEDGSSPKRARPLVCAPNLAVHALHGGAWLGEACRGASGLVTRTLLAQSPYRTKGQPDISNARDGIYQGGGSQLLVTPVGEGSGYGVTFDLALQY